MASQIEEFLAKKKEQTTLLDLHNCTANSKEELRKLVEKVPEFKIKPEKVIFYLYLFLILSIYCYNIYYIICFSYKL
jgi:hypothetical protein